MELLNRGAKDVVYKLCGRSDRGLVHIICRYPTVLQDWAEDFGLGLGKSCHWIWGMKKAILRYGFNIDWQTPAEKNPHVIYD